MQYIDDVLSTISFMIYPLSFFSMFLFSSSFFFIFLISALHWAFYPIWDDLCCRLIYSNKLIFNILYLSNINNIQ